MKTLYLFNPLSAEGYAPQFWKQARALADYLPEEPIDLTKIENKVEYIAAKDPDLVVIAGGDGSINAVCGAILQLKKKPRIAVMPVGFGNALAYCLGVDTLEKSLYVIKNAPQIVRMDMMKTSIPSYPYAVFNMSVGFDARIIHRRMTDRYIGMRSYVLSAVRSILEHNENEIVFTVDNTVAITATASSLVIANAPTIGKNWMVTDSAYLNDGYLDCTLFSSKFAYLTNLRLKGFKHPLYNNLGKVRFKARHIKVEGEPLVQVDGDPATLRASLEVDVIPHAIEVLCNESSQIDIPYLPFEEELNKDH